MKFNFNNEEVRRYLFEGEFGLEKESLRIDENGNLAHTPHPFEGNSHIDRDFCENQIELITDVHDSIDGVCNELLKLQLLTEDLLLNLKTGKEYLWPFSNPPYVRGEDDIPIANFTGELHRKKIYRKYLAEKYGKKKMLFSGVHFSFSFPEKVLKAGFVKSGYKSYRKYKDDIYINLCAKLVKYGWLIVYLTAASPVFDGSFFEIEKRDVDILCDYASPRCGKDGYWNKFVPVLNFESITSYADSISEYIRNGQIMAEAELYYPVRLKPRGKYLIENLKKNGVNHIELRMLDLNPMYPAAVCPQDLKFIHLLIIYLMLRDDENIDAFDQTSAIRNIKNAALYDAKKITIEGWHEESGNVNDESGKILFDMEQTLLKFFPEKASDIKKCIDFQRNKIENPAERYAEKIRKDFIPEYVKKGIRLAKAYSAKNKNE